MTNGHQSVTEELAAVLRESSYTAEQIADTALHVLYPNLSPGAADTFRQLGRGAVLMDLRDLEQGKLDTSYMPQALLRRLNAELELFDDAEAAVADYDPEGEFVVIVWQVALILIYRLPLV